MKITTKVKRLKAIVCLEMTCEEAIKVMPVVHKIMKHEPSVAEHVRLMIDNIKDFPPAKVLI